MADSRGLLEMQPRPGVFIQFAGTADQTASNLQAIDGHCLFARHLLSTITNRKFNIGEIFKRISDSVYQESKHKQTALSMNGLNGLSEVCLMEVISGTYRRKPEECMEIPEYVVFFTTTSRVHFSLETLVSSYPQVASLKSCCKMCSDPIHEQYRC